MKRIYVVIMMFCAMATFAFTQTRATPPQYNTTTQTQTTNAWRYCNGGQPVQVQSQATYRYGMPSHQLMVTNATPYFMEVYVGKLQARNDLAPGEAASTAVKKSDGKKHFFGKSSAFVGYARSSNIDVPITARFYVDAEHQVYLGASIAKITLPGYGTTSSDSLVFRSENIWFAEGVNCHDLPASNATANFVIKPLIADFDSGEGDGIWVFVWNSTTPASLIVNGEDCGLLQQGKLSMYYLATRKMVDIRIATRDTNGIHIWSRSYSNQNFYGTTAWELSILSTRDLH
jgi:hypothetical protein